MMIALAVLSLLLVVVLAAVVVVVWRRRPAAASWLESTLKKRIVVHLCDGLTIDGTLMEQAADGVILRAAKLLGDDKRETLMAGETFVPRENIAFAQLDE